MNVPLRARNRWIPIFGTLIGALLIWMLRRPDQVIHPFMWAEESDVLRALEHHGTLAAMGVPITGEFMWVVTVPLALIFRFGFLWAPAIAYLIATTYFVAFCLLWLVPQSRLTMTTRVLIVFATVLAPMNPETFGVLLYSFWWSALLLLPIVFWKKPLLWLRFPILVVAGMSSLAGSLLFVVFSLAWVLWRNRCNLVSAGILALTFVAQVWAVLVTGRSNQNHVDPAPLCLQSLKNVGAYLLAWLPGLSDSFEEFIGAAFLLALVGVAVLSRRAFPHFGEFLILLTAFVLLDILSSVPAAGVSNPYTAGPRYYFYPFVLLSWVLAILATSDVRPLVALGIAGLSLALVTLGPAWNRHHTTLEWENQLIMACRVAPPTPILFHSDGDVSHAWTVPLTSAICREIAGY